MYLGKHRANVANLRVVAGEHDLDTVSGLEQNRNVSSYKMHEKYNALTYENDIALISVSDTQQWENNRILNSSHVICYFLVGLSLGLECSIRQSS